MSIIDDYLNFDDNSLVFKCDVKNKERFNAVIRTKINTDSEIPEQVKKWITSFSEATHTNWIVERENSNPKRFLYKKMYTCQHSIKNKNKSSSEQHIRKRNLQCTANITILVKKTTKGTIQNDPMLKNGFNGEIKVRT